MGNPRGYTEILDPGAVPYKQWMNPQPSYPHSQRWGDSFQFDGMSRTVISMSLYRENVFGTRSHKTDLGMPRRWKFSTQRSLTSSRTPLTAAHGKFGTDRASTNVN